MKKILLIIFFSLSIINNSYCQQWTGWEDVQNSGVQVSFKFATQSGASSRIRFRNNTQSTFCLVSVEFEVSLDGKQHTVPMSAYTLASNGGIDDNAGKWFHSDNNIVSNMRLVKLQNSDCKDILGGGVSHSNGVSNITYEKKDTPKTQQQIQKEKQEQEQIKREQELRQQKINQEAELKRKSEAENKRNAETGSAINQSIQDIGNAIIEENDKKYQAERAQLVKEYEEHNRIKEQANHPVKFEENNNSIFLLYNDATGDIGLSKNGKVDNDVLFNTMEYNNSRMLIVFKMSEEKVYFSASGIKPGKTYLTELNPKGSTLLLYFVSTKLTSKSTPPYMFFNFSTGRYTIAKEENGSILGSWQENFERLQSKSDEVYLIRNNSDGSLKFENHK
ncbi:MAG: hypothetical protein V9G42_06635 [Bacteroidia bacterium]|jgi:hypothetical protein